MKKERRVNRIVKACLVLLILTVGFGIYAMKHHLGFIDGLNFGAGQYYYTDIPGWQKYFTETHYQSPVSMWILIVLFFAWGALMFKAWTWLERKIK